MNCVKCGREIPEDQVFCEVCLTEMENYPVKPGTAVHIPARTAEEPPKKPVKRKRIPTAEELLLKTRKKLRRTRIFAVILLLVCGLLSFLMAQAVLELDFQRILGQNYRTEKGNTSTKPLPEWTQLTTAPAEPETELPAPAAESDMPDHRNVQQPAPETEEKPAEVPTLVPTEAPTEIPSEPAAQPPTEMPTEVPETQPSEAPAQPPTEAPAGATEPAPPATEAPAAPSEPLTEMTTEPPVTEVPQPAEEPAAE